MKASNYNLRNICRVSLPNFNTATYGQRHFKYYGAHIWNHVPPHFKQAESIYAFKRHIKIKRGQFPFANVICVEF